MIQDGHAIQLHLEVRFQDGLVALSTFEEEPIACRIGDGTFTPAFEASLKGLHEGADTLLLASGSLLFGPYEESNRHWVDRDEFPQGIEPVPGQVLGFVTPAGQETSGIVLDLEEQRILVDFNHPFSGRDLSLRIKVLSVAP
ncbi:peptidylprolyl isomerase [Thiocystis violacea]|nr:peptidylprolyl isomerase [Thiocystis violacea]